MSVQGNWMPCDLSDPSPLADAVSSPGRPSAELLRFSYELAVTAYDFDLQRWHAALWQDFSLRLNERLLTGTAINDEDSRFQSTVKTGYHQIVARQRMRFTSPRTQYKGTGDGSDHAKAVFMLHPLEGGRYVVGIGFTGTCKRVDDWVPNLLMDEKDEMHAGFLRLSREIWSISGQVSFPACARSLGLPSLTLADIFTECTQENSRFLIWMSGHSQGGAVMQLFARYLHHKGVLPQNLIGCGFACPSVLWQPEAAPMHLHLVMNDDDLIPRFGARSHYGQVWLAELTDIERRLCYTAEIDRPCMQALLDMSHQIRRTEDALLVTCCLLELFQDEEEIRAPQALNGLLAYLKVDPLQKVEEQLTRLTDKIRRRAMRYYTAFTGREEMDSARYSRVMSALWKTMLRYGDGEFARCLKSVLGSPHRLRNNESAHIISPYYLICHAGDHPMRAVSDADLEVCPPMKYADSLPPQSPARTRHRHLKLRRFHADRAKKAGKHHWRKH